MSQTTRDRLRDQINLFREGPDQVPFNELIDPEMVDRAFREEGAVPWSARIFVPLVVLWTFLSQVLSPDHSCRKAVSRLIAYLTARGHRACEKDSGAYCKARQRLPLGVVQHLARATAATIDERTHEDWKWHGREVVLADGTTVSMPDTSENQRAFPQQKGQAPGLGFPIARLVATISLATGAIEDLAIGPYQGKETGETALFRTLIERLVPGAIVLGDRTFGSYFGIAALLERGCDGVFRMHQGRKVDFRRGERLGPEDHLVRWPKPARPEWMDQAAYDQVPEELVVREVRFAVPQEGFRVEEVVLATTLLDRELWPREELAALYRDRWNIELDLRSIKIEMQMDVLRCKSPDMVKKEIWMHVLAYNLVRGVMAAAAEEHDEEPRNLSFKGALQALESFREEAGGVHGPARYRLVDAVLAMIASETVGERPNRVEPRAIKRRPKPHRLLKEPRREARKRLLAKK